MRNVGGRAMLGDWTVVLHFFRHMAMTIHGMFMVKIYDTAKADEIGVVK